MTTRNDDASIIDTRLAPPLATYTRLPSGCGISLAAALNHAQVASGKKPAR